MNWLWAGLAYIFVIGVVSIFFEHFLFVEEDEDVQDSDEEV